MINLVNKARDELLDFYKGIAISIVVLGHTYQNIFSPETFLNETGFRFIGAMQMPFFVFLSGATASIWIAKFNPSASPKDLINSCMSRIRSASFRLLLPFLSWTLIGLAINVRHDGTLEYFKMVFRDPMYSLWFLLCIFYCVFTWSLMQAVLAFFLKLSEGFEIANRYREKVLGIWGQILFIFIFWELIKNYIPRIFGTWFLIEYFIYFILGVAFYAALKSDKRLLNQILQTLFSLRFSWIIYLGFLALAPFWSLTADNNLEPYSFHFYGKRYLNYLYRFFVAMFGIYVALDISKRFYSLNILSINKFVVYLGKMSIGIYALHNYFLSLYPPVVAPLLVSVGITYFILQVPYLRNFLLGESRATQA